MHAITEIDKAGRIVVPKKLRDSLHLVAGTRVTICEHGGDLLIRAAVAPRGLFLDHGTLVYDAGPLPPVDTREWLARSREDRADSLKGGGGKP